jgi:hypothetical protein
VPAYAAQKPAEQGLGHLDKFQPGMIVRFWAPCR